MDLQLQPSQQDHRTEYHVRRNRRARHAQIKINQAGKVIVVVPQRFRLSQVPDLIARQQSWIDDQVRRIRNKFNPVYDSDRPEKVNLRATGEHWLLEYPESGCGIKMYCEQTKHQHRLTVGSRNQVAVDLLSKWLTQKARQYLVSCANEISEATGLHAAKFSIRNQKTRWGSCSSRKTISLNRSLLFIPERLVRYLILHELCHTVVMNHSRQYWDLVERFEPNYRSLDKELSAASRYIPLWAMPGV